LINFDSLSTTFEVSDIFMAAGAVVKIVLNTKTKLPQPNLTKLGLSSHNQKMRRYVKSSKSWESVVEVKNVY